jgi:hypothetical protein
MSKEKINITMPDGTTEIVIREGAAIKVLDPKAPIKIDLKGVIQAPYIFLSKRVVQRLENSTVEFQLNAARCHILVSREKVSITLIMNENDDYIRGQVVGKLETDPKFEEFGINTSKVWTPTQLGLFFKMNRYFFTSKEDNMKLVNDLLNFTATVNNSIQRSVKESGDKTDNFEQVVNSNLPKSFNLKIPIIKGFQAEIIEVETFAQINGKEVSFTLMSPGAQATYEEVRDTIIDTEIKKFEELVPMVPIIEQ